MHKSTSFFFVRYGGHRRLAIDVRKQGHGKERQVARRAIGTSHSRLPFFPHRAGEQKMHHRQGSHEPGQVVRSSNSRVPLDSLLPLGRAGRFFTALAAATRLQIQIFSVQRQCVDRRTGASCPLSLGEGKAEDALHRAIVTLHTARRRSTAAIPGRNIASVAGSGTVLAASEPPPAVAPKFVFHTA